MSVPFSCLAIPDASDEDQFSLKLSSIIYLVESYGSAAAASGEFSLLSMVSNLPGLTLQ